MQKKTLRARAYLYLIPIIFALSCSNDPSGTSETTDPGPQPNPAGVLLPGNPGDNARDRVCECKRHHRPR